MLWSWTYFSGGKFISAAASRLGQNVTLTLQICAEPQKYPNRYLYITKIKDSLYKGKILVSVVSQGAFL